MNVTTCVSIGSDHNGNAARAYVVDLLERLHKDPQSSMSFCIHDAGPFEDQGKVDYPDIARKVCFSVLANGKNARGILICGTGTGMSIVANRFKGIRAALVTDRATSVLSREHNDANILVLGQWRNSLASMDEIVKVWFETPFKAGRHAPRIKKVADIGGMEP